MGVPIYLYAGGAVIPATLDDLSEGGMLVRLDAAVELPGMVSLEFEVRSGARCTASGTVVRASDDAVGVRFSEINDSMRQFVRDLVSLRPELRDAFVAGVTDPRIRLE